jgi:hypothetical protein
MAVAIAVGVLFGAIVPDAWAQGGGAVSPNPPGIPATSPSEGGGTKVALLVFGLLALACVIAWVKLLDLRRKRNDEAVNVQTQISDSLLRDRALGTLPVAPTVHVPVLSRAPVTIEIHGQVPASETRDAVLRLAEREASRSLASYHIEDRMTVAPAGIRVG